jgi:hypothetical protein
MTGDFEALAKLELGGTGWSPDRKSHLHDQGYSGRNAGERRRVSVFIDVIGMPLTPLSYAGVARRTYRRAVLS